MFACAETNGVPERRRIRLGQHQPEHNLKTINAITALAILASGITASYGASITLDGIYDAGSDDYANSATVTWYQGHKNEFSIYGDFDNQSYTTTIRWGVAEDADGIMGEEFFFLYVEAPLYAKNMVWGDALPEADKTPYRVHHETHHGVGDLDLDFSDATGSEKIVIVNSGGSDEFEADLAGNVDNAFNYLDSKDSWDYLRDNTSHTETLSTARDQVMSFEMKFELNQDGSADAMALVNFARDNGLELHLSPERGLVPEPSSSLLLVLSSAFLLIRRKR